jgi:hypothetical protein
MDPSTVIAGLDPAIPMNGHGCAFLSGMAGSSPAMTIPPEGIISNDVSYDISFVKRASQQK